MEIFWNTGERETIRGLDIMGLRQQDQKIEQELVVNITTISIRARYLTLLPWIYAEFYQKELALHGGKAAFDAEQFQNVLARMEFAVIAAARIHSQGAESDANSGMIGPDVFKDELAEFLDNDRLSLDFGGRGGTSLNTYIMPCRGFGILNTDLGEVSAPVSITPRGTQIFKARKNQLNSNGLKKVILEGGTLTRKMIEDDGHHVSVNHLSSNPEERDLLRRALLEPYDANNSDVKMQYNRFAQTIRWVFESIKKQPEQSAANIINNHYKCIVTTQEPHLNEVTTAWGEYELRRRCHFACELLLSALTETLRDEMTVETVEDVLANWETRNTSSELMDRILSTDEISFSKTLGDLKNRVPSDAFLANGVNVRQAREQSPAVRGHYALLLLLACKNQTDSLRAKGHIPNRKHYMERAFEILEEDESSVWRILRSLLVAVTIEPHLTTSLRKLGQGQKCSLRFFPEGNVLRPTGIGVQAGFSGSRLGNVLNFLADVGYLDRNGNGRFSVSPDGEDLFQKLWGEK